VNRPWVIAAAFGLCLVVGVAAVAWLSREVWQLDERNAVARAQQEHDERVRLALWRLDSALSPILAPEIARPYRAFSPFFSPEQAYSRNFAPLDFGNVQVISPLLRSRARFIVQHFQFEKDGSLTSPQAPTGNARDVVEGRLIATSAEIVKATDRLEVLRQAVSREDMQFLLPEPKTPTHEPPVEEQEARTRLGRPAQQQMAGDFQRRAMQNQMYGGKFINPEQPSQIQPRAQTAAVPQAAIDKVKLGEEANQRGDAPGVKSQAFVDKKDLPQQQEGDFDAFNMMFDQPPQPPKRVIDGPFQPLWFGDRLLVARRVLLDSDEIVQGFELDWPALRTWLREQAVDLLPELELSPLREWDDDERCYRLASLPIRLTADAPVLAMESGWSPAKLSVVAAWIGSAVAVIAVAFLLVGAVSLSERRAAFVSSVTHELRTPLTTFRMYAEMLARGMVPNEEDRRRYLRTLQAEADRLAHLVENVLSYARLERGRHIAKTEPIKLGDLLDRVDERLERRTKEVGMVWARDRSDPALSKEVMVDRIAVEQILFNLVDNACKYAKDAADQTIELTISPPSKRARLDLAVRDHGPGVAPKGALRMFKGFRKSATEAAHTAPGAGLGLALSRRLARRMGGNLHWEKPTDGTGARFVLTIPLVVS
jgi:signal transduction histidine kinase